MAPAFCPLLCCGIVVGRGPPLGPKIPLDKSSHISLLVGLLRLLLLLLMVPTVQLRVRWLIMLINILLLLLLL